MTSPLPKLLKISFVFIFLALFGEAQMTPELVAQVYSVYEKIAKEATGEGTPSGTPPIPTAEMPPAPVTSAVPAPSKVIPSIPPNAEEFSKLLSESENPRYLVGTSPLLTSPLLERTAFFEIKENDTEEVKQELQYLSKLKIFLLQKEETFDAKPFLRTCKQSGPYWIEYLLSQQTSDFIRERTFESLLASPSLFSALLTAPQSQNYPELLRFWAARFSTDDPIHLAMLLTLANAHPGLESEVLKPILPENSLIYPKLLKESPELATEEDLLAALVSLASPHPARRINTATLLAKTPKADGICRSMIQLSPEIRVVILNQYPLAVLKGINTPYALAAYHRRLGVGASDLAEKIKHFTFAAETGADGKESLKTIFSLQESAAVIGAIPLTTRALGTLLQDLKDFEPTQLQVFSAPLQKAGEKAKGGDEDSLALLLLAGRNPNLEEMLLPILSSIYPAEVALPILQLTQGKNNAVTEEARQGNASALEALRVLTRDSQIPMKQAAYDSIALLANVDAKARELFLTLAKDKDPMVRQFTVMSLASKALRKKELLTVLLDAAKDTHPGIRQAAASSLIVSALRNNAEATQALANLAEKDPVDSVKKSAIQALANSSTAGNTTAAEILKSLAAHSNPVIAQTAQAAQATLPK